MKIENMEKAVKDRWKSKGDFIYQCITNDHQWDCPGSAAVYEGHWRAASSFNGFLKAVQMDERLTPHRHMARSVVWIAGPSR